MSTPPTKSFSLLVPPRLTPSPPLEIDPTGLPPSNDPPIPPLRKSIYPHPTNPTWHVNVVPYSLSWATDFTTIQSHLHTLFTTSNPPVFYQTIEHIGSTAVPNLPAKPNIDVLVTFASEAHLAQAIEALDWEIPTSPPFTRYTRVIPPGGGIAGRESYKLYLHEYSPYYAGTPERSVYLVADVPENEAGQVQIRCYRTVRDVLQKPENENLLREYGEVKVGLGRQVFGDPLEYSARKDGIVRKILMRGGWTEEEATRKEELTRRVWSVDSEEEAY